MNNTANKKMRVKPN